MQVRKNRAVNLGSAKIVRLQALETGIIADTPVPGKEEQVLLPSLIRGPATIRDLSVPLVGDSTMESAGERPGDATSVGIRDIAFAIVRRGRIPG